jgi:rhodanese-related sulfurtransferase/CRP-like cAMP-binding protein
MRLSQDWQQHLIKTCVPLGGLTTDHIATLMRDAPIQVACRGQTLLQKGLCDAKVFYLLSGELTVVDTQGQQQNIHAGDAEAHYPIAHAQPRRHDVIAASDCEYVCFDAEKLDAILAWEQAAQCILADITGNRELDEDAQWMTALLRSNLFHKVPPMNIREILHKFEPQYFSAGETVLRQGEMGDCCYYIKEGKVAIYRSDDERLPPKLLAEMSVGKCFGEDALVNDAPRNATVVMQENGVLMRLVKQDFFVLLKPPVVESVDFRSLPSLKEQGAVLIDVRTEAEYDQGHAQSAVNMPLPLLPFKFRLLNKQQTYVIYCNSGRRSAAAAAFLSAAGFDVRFLRGGYTAMPQLQQDLFLDDKRSAVLRKE